MIDITDPVYFYNKNGTDEILYKLTTILYTDNDICLCVAKPMFDEDGENQNIFYKDLKIVFYIEDGFVDNQTNHSLRATNELDVARSYLFH